MTTQPTHAQAASGRAASDSARGRARPDFPAVVHTYTDVLRVLRDQGDRTAAELAQATGRVLSNVKRDLHKLVAADVVALSTDFASLTDKGRQWLAGMDVAQGGEHRGPHILVPLDQLEFNPDNPRGTIRDVEGLADSIVADADQGGPGVIQPLSVSPPDANGVRIVWAGNRRLAAVRLLAEQNRLPAALVDGLPCVEREADAVQALLLAIVENGQRADLSPLEDARALAALADASGWSAREVAKQTGRSPADSEAGVRDVQVKIKVAREATPEAIAEYERTGSWDALRDSVTKPRPRPAPEQELREALAACGPAVLAGPEAGDQLDIEDVAPRDRANGPDWVNGTPYTRRFDRHHPTHTAGDFAPDLPWTPDGFAPLADALEPDALATYRINEDAGHGFPAAQIQVAALRGGRGWIYAAGYSTAPLGHHESLLFRPGLVARREEAFPDRETAIAAGVDLIRDSLGRLLKWKLPAKIDAWLRQMETPAQRPAAVETTAAAPAAPAAPATDDPLVVDGVRYPNLTRANEARARLEGKRISIAAPTRPAASPAAAPSGVASGVERAMAPAAEAAPADPWGRDANEIVADKALRLKAEDLALGRKTGSAEWARDLLAAAGVSGPFRADKAEIVALDGPGSPRSLLTIDAGGHLPPERAWALALLVAHALNRAFDFDAAVATPAEDTVR